MLGALVAAMAVGIALADAIGASARAGWIAAVLGGFALSRPRWRAGAALLLAFAAGWSALAERRATALAGSAIAPREGLVEGVVVRRSAAWNPRWIDLEEVRGAGTRRLRLYADAPEQLDPWLPGDRVRARLRLAPLRSARNPGSHGAAERHARAGLGLSGSVAHPSLIVGEASRSRIPHRLHALRRRIARRLAAAGEGAGLLRGLALGDREAIPETRRDAFARLGLAHALAVSGLHLAWVVALGYGATRLGVGRIAWIAARADARRLALIPAGLLGLLYAAMAGFGVPVRRALLLLLAAGLAIARSRPALPGAALAGAALWILAREPGALFALGAQLSFAAVAAFVAARPAPHREPAAGRCARTLRLAASALRHSATAILATAPLLAWHGAGTSPVALAANLVLLPWLGVVLLPAALLAAAAVALELPGDALVAGAVAGLADATGRWLEALASGLPAPERARPRLPVRLVTLGLAGGGLACRSTFVRVGSAWGVSMLLATASPEELRPSPPRLVALEVGQGDALLVQGPRSAVLVDAGGAYADWDAGRRRVVPALRALGVARLDLVIASHSDLDHRGGLPAVLDALPVSELWLPRGSAPEAGFAALLATAQRRGVAVREMGRGSPRRRIGSLRVAPLWPPREGIGSRNARSLVVRIDVAGGHSVLLPGDLEAGAERELIARASELRADVLVLPHHGSRSSSTQAFLDAVSPRLAIASAPCRGRFGMPHREVRERLAARAIPMGWTGRDGALRVALRGPLALRGAGVPARCP